MFILFPEKYNYFGLDYRLSLDTPVSQTQWSPHPLKIGQKIVPVGKGTLKFQPLWEFPYDFVPILDFGGGSVGRKII